MKAWVVQTLGSGVPVRTWSGNTDVGVSRVRPRVVRDAVLARYGFLADLPGLVPLEMFDGIPAKMRGVAAGQWIVQREAAILARAMLALVSAGVPVLPVHDAVIVPVGEAQRARAALENAFVDLAGIRPRVKIAWPGAGALAALPAQEAA